MGVQWWENARRPGGLLRLATVPRPNHRLQRLHRSIVAEAQPAIQRSCAGQLQSCWRIWHCRAGQPCPRHQAGVPVIAKASPRGQLQQLPPAAARQLRLGMLLVTARSCSIPKAFAAKPSDRITTLDRPTFFHVGCIGQFPGGSVPPVPL